MTAKPITPTALKNLKDEALKGIAPAFEYSYVHTAEQWIERCEQDLAQMWLEDELWGITEVLETPNDGRVLHLIALAGKFTDAALEHIEAWGKSVGCKRIRLTGRPGWERRLPGWTVTSKLECKELSVPIANSSSARGGKDGR